MATRPPRTQAAFDVGAAEPSRRRATDRVRLVAAVVGTVLLLTPAGPGAVEEALQTLVDAVPDAFDGAAELTLQLGTLWAVLLTLATALVARRWRLARDLVAAGLLAWWLGRFAAGLVAGDGVAAAVGGAFLLGDAVPVPPPTRVALVVAVLCAAGPHLSRPARRIGKVVGAAVVLAALQLGLGDPSGVAAAVTVGWGVAALVHLVVGSPGGRPTVAQLRRALDELGVDVADLHPSVEQPLGASWFEGRDHGGPLSVRVLGRDERDARVAAQLWRKVLYRSEPGRWFLTRLDAVEHEALCLALAERGGVTVPELVVTGATGPGMALVAVRPLAGAALSGTTPAGTAAGTAADEATLDAAWAQLGRLHDARVAHLDLTAERIVVLERAGPDGGPVGIDGFERAVTPAPERARQGDRVALLAATARLVGPDAAVDAARRALGDDALAELLPVLQRSLVPTDPDRRERRSLPFSADQRAERAAADELLTSLRSTVATRLGVDEPQLLRLRRLDTASVLMVVGTVLGVAALLSQVGDPAEFAATLRGANWWWVGAALAVSVATCLPTALALMGSVPAPLPLGPTTELQLAIRFINLAAPTVGGLAAQIRFLQRHGVDLPTAVAGGGVVSGVVNVGVNVVLCLAALWLSPFSVDPGAVSADGSLRWLVLAVGVLVVAGVVVWFVPPVRRRVVPPVRAAAGAVAVLARSPRRMTQLCLGWAGASLLSAVALWACIAAFGDTVDLWTVLLINTGVGVLAFVVPIPGSATAIGSVGIAAGLTAVGVPDEVAVAASLAFQLTSSFLPAVPGWWSLRRLLRAGLL